MQELNGLSLFTLNIPFIENLKIFTLTIPFIDELKERCLVGAGIVGGFQHTSKLKLMKYKEEMASLDKHKFVQWDDVVEHEKFVLYDVWDAVDIEEVPEEATILLSTWVMKMKADGTCRSRLTKQAFEEVDSLDYHSTDTSAPVVNDNSATNILALTIKGGWIAPCVT